MTESLENELIDLMVDISKKRRKVIDGIHKYVDEKCEHKDVGLESWFVIELASILQERYRDFKYQSRGPDLLFDNEKTPIELKATTSLRYPHWIIDEGLIRHKAPVLFFSGYLNKKKIDYHDEDEVADVFRKHINSTKTKQKRTKRIADKFDGLSSINVMYKIIELGDKCIVGFVKPSNDFCCKPVK